MQSICPTLSILGRLVLVCLCAFALDANALENTTEGEQASAFQQLAMNLRPLSKAIRADFALAAITETVALHRKETQRGSLPSTSAKTERWASNVERYTDQLQSLADSITADTPIGIHLGPDSLVYLQVAQQMVVISSPRLHQQTLLEQTITLHFCNQYPCDDLIAGYSNADYRHIETLPHWQFRMTPFPVCNTGDGLELMYGNNDQLLKKRDVCKQLFTELALLAEALTQKQQQGVSVEWHRVSIESAPDAGHHRVILNDQGDSLELALPACAASTELFRRVLPWLRSKVAGEADQSILLVITNAEYLLSVLLQ